MAAMTALALVTAGAAVYSGDRANKESKRQRRLNDMMTLAEAEAHEDDVKKFAAEQELAFLNSGVTLEGSPLLVLKETREKGLLDTENILKSGNARSEAIRSSGRTAFFQGLVGGVSGGIRAYGAASDAPKKDAGKPDRMYYGGFNDPRSDRMIG